MVTDVLLMSDVPRVGSEGDVVQVADGYARNYLFPKKLAAEVTQATRKRLQKIRRDREIRRTHEVEEARSMAATLAQASCTIAVKTGEEDQMYGSVTAADVAESLAAQGIEIDRNCLAMEKAIKELGVFDIEVKLHPEVTGTVKVWVVEE